MVDTYTGGHGEFTYSGGCVSPGETEHIRYSVTETYLGDSVRIPVSIINGEADGPAVFLTAAVHGDELNGIEVVRSVAREWNHNNINGTLVCIPVMNPLGFMAQERYVPIQDKDLNRSFPGKADSSSANRIAHTIWETFLTKCDIGLDFHTSTRGRTNMMHVRADMELQEVERLAKSFGTSVIMDTNGSSGMLRYESADAGIPAVTIELGEAHRFERDYIEQALTGIRSVFAEYNIHPQESVRWPRWTTIVDGWDEKTWLRASSGGLAEMHHEAGEMVLEGNTICTVTNPFKRQKETINAPYTGMIVGCLKNPVVSPGNPLCHFIKIGDESERILQTLQAVGGECLGA